MEDRFDRHMSALKSRRKTFQMYHLAVSQHKQHKTISLADKRRCSSVQSGIFLKAPKDGGPPLNYGKSMKNLSRKPREAQSASSRGRLMLQMALEKNHSVQLKENEEKTEAWLKTLPNSSSNTGKSLVADSEARSVLSRDEMDIELVAPSDSSCISEIIDYNATKNRIVNLDILKHPLLMKKKFKDSKKFTSSSSSVSGRRKELLSGKTEGDPLEFLLEPQSSACGQLILDDQTGEFREKVTIEAIGSRSSRQCSKESTLTSKPKRSNYILADEEIEESGSEYIPSSTDESADEDMTNFQRSSRSKRDGKSEASASIQMEKAHSGKKTSAPVKEDKSIMVITTNNFGNIRKHDKKPFCFFCGIPQSQIVRHWLAKHKTENEVTRIEAADKNEKRKLMIRLRNMGNHVHNVAVLRDGRGLFLVSYRPRKQVSPHDYLPCESCFAYLHRTKLFRHKCQIRGKSKGRVISKSELLLPVSGDLTVDVNTLLNGMINSDVKLIARNDAIIKMFASKLIQRHSFERRGYVRAKVREITRFLMEMRKRSLAVTLKDCIDPTLFREAIECVKSLSGYDALTCAHRTPSLALKIGQSLKKCAKLVKADAIITEDQSVLDRADRFFALCDLEWNDAVSFSAHQTLTDRNRNKINLLPLSDDVLKLHEFLKKAILQNSQQLSGVGSNKEVIWRGLAEATLTQLICFNRRRQGEVSSMKVTDYERKTTEDMDADIQKSLGTFEQHLCKIFSRIEIRGKRGRTVPVLILAETKNAIDLLQKKRQDVGIPKSNPFIFAYSNSDNHLRGSDCLRTFSKACGAKFPDRLRSTNLRKHVATLSQVLNLKENEMDMLAQFMGHDIRVHRQFYRLPDNTLQVAVLAKIFMMMENGTITENNGRSLDNVLIQRNGENLAVDVFHEVGDNNITATGDDKLDIGTSDLSPDTGNSDCDNEEVRGSASPVDSGSLFSLRKHKHFKRKPSVKLDSAVSSSVKTRSESLSEENVMSCHQLSKADKFGGGDNDGENSWRNNEKRKVSGKVPWTEEEKKAVEKHLLKYILCEEYGLPGKDEILKCLNAESCLSSRNWRNIKDFVRNQKTARIRMQK